MGPARAAFSAPSLSLSPPLSSQRRHRPQLISQLRRPTTCWAAQPERLPADATAQQRDSSELRGGDASFVSVAHVPAPLGCANSMVDVRVRRGRVAAVADGSSGRGDGVAVERRTDGSVCHGCCRWTDGRTGARTDGRARRRTVGRVRGRTDLGRARGRTVGRETKPSEQMSSLCKP